MVNIEKIVGKKSYARLQKAGISTQNKLSRLQPEQVMVLAGIGPKTAKKLFTALGKKPGNIKKLEKEYRKLKTRTKLKNIGMSILKVSENPEPVKNILEQRRREAHLWQNFLAHAYNFANPDKPKVKAIPYGPVSVNLDPTTMKYQTAKRRQMAQYSILQEENRFVLTLNTYDMENNEDLSETKEFVWETQYNERVGLLILDNIRDEYTQFRSKTADGMFVVVMDSKLEDLAVLIKDKYKPDIDKNIFSVTPNRQDYYNYEILYKYYENPVLRQIVDRFDAFNQFYLYEEALEESNKKMDYETFINNDVASWWDTVNKLQQSYIQFTDARNFSAAFGIIEGRLYGYQNQYSKKKFESSWILRELPETYNEFIETKKKGNITIDRFSMPVHLLAMINYVLDRDFSLWSSYSGQSLIFQSNRFPEWGFVVTFS